MRDFGNVMILNMSASVRVESQIRNELQWQSLPDYGQPFNRSVRIDHNNRVLCPFFEEVVNYYDKRLNCPSFEEKFHVNGTFECLSKATLKERKEKI